MKTPEEIKRGLECCAVAACGFCPFEYGCNLTEGYTSLSNNALAYIRQLENQLRETTKMAMTDEAKKLVENLREHSDWAHANEWETPITLGDDLDAATDMIVSLSEALADIGSACAKARESMDRALGHLIDLRFTHENDEKREEL